MRELAPQSCLFERLIHTRLAPESQELRSLRTERIISRVLHFQGIASELFSEIRS